MKIREIMTRTVHMAQAAQTLQDAARMMRDEDVGMLPVFNGPDVVGILTDRDIVLNAVAGGLSPQKARVSDTMSKNVITVEESESCEAAAQKMKDYQIRRLIVVDRDRRPVGIVSLGDLATRIDDPDLAESVVEVVSEDRARPHH